MNNKFLFKILEGQNIDNKYYLKSLLGTGGFGGVYLADEVVRDRFIRELAIKLIITDNPDKQLDELIFSTTLKHPNLLNCYTCGECQLNNLDFLYLLMEKADYSLEDKLTEDKLSEEEVKQLVLDISNGLDYLHSQKPVIVHRDLKPGNILKVGDKWKISDFGLVRSVQNNSTKTTTMMGSMGYAPPEAYQGKISSAWDMWSLGIIIYEALTGELPFKNDTPLALMQEVINHEPDLNIIPKNWQGIVNNCLKKDEKQRLIAKNLINNLPSNIAIKFNEKDASSYFKSGYNYGELKEYEKAIIEYTKAIELNANYTNAHYNRGVSYSKLKQYEKAIIDYSKVIELDPNYKLAHYNRGVSYSKLKQYEKALIDYNKAIELKPNYTIAINNKKIVEKEIKKQKLIAQNLINNLPSNIAIKSNEDASSYFKSGKNYYELKQYQKAIIDYTKAIELNPNYTDAYNHRGIAYKNLKQYEKAIIDYTKAIKLDPNYTSAYNNRGLAYHDLKEYNKAIIDYTKAIELDSNYANAYNNRGVIYQNLQEYKKAIIDYTKAIKLKPNHTNAINNKKIAEDEMKKQKKWFIF